MLNSVKLRCPKKIPEFLPVSFVTKFIVQLSLSMLLIFAESFTFTLQTLKSNRFFLYNLMYGFVTLSIFTGAVGVGTESCMELPYKVNPTMLQSLLSLSTMLVDLSVVTLI